MLAASICREVHFTVLSSTTMASRVPRCLFGKPNPRETVEMLQEALDVERSKFAKRWGVDPRSEDKENSYQRKPQDKYEQSPKKRSNPYSRQTSIHGEYRFSDKALFLNIAAGVFRRERTVFPIRNIMELLATQRVLCIKCDSALRGNLEL